MSSPPGGNPLSGKMARYLAQKRGELNDEVSRSDVKEVIIDHLKSLRARLGKDTGFLEVFGRVQEAVEVVVGLKAGDVEM